jgi:hypothetical protein
VLAQCDRQTSIARLSAKTGDAAQAADTIAFDYGETSKIAASRFRKASARANVR